MAVSLLFKRNKCKCCKYKRDFRLFVTATLRNDFTAENVQTLCTCLQVAIERPKKLSQSDSKEVYPLYVPAVLWELDNEGFLETWSQTPHKFQREILTRLLQRVDLAKSLQHLLDKYPTVRDCLQRFDSSESSLNSSRETLVLAVQETLSSPQVTVIAEEESNTNEEPQTSQETEHQLPTLETHQQTESHLSPSHNNLQLPFQNEFLSPELGPILRPRRDSDTGPDRRSRHPSSGFFERTMSGIPSRSASVSSAYRHTRNDSGLSISSGRRMTNDSLFSTIIPNLSTTHSLTTVTRAGTPTHTKKPCITESFCTNCRTWIASISPNGSQASRSQTSSPPASLTGSSYNGKTNSNSTDEFISSASVKFQPSIPVSQEAQLRRFFARLEVKRNKLINKLESSKPNKIKERPLSPVAGGSRGNPLQYKIRLHPAHSQNSEVVTTSDPQRCATLSLDAIPVSQGDVRVPSMTATLSVYLTNDKSSAMSEECTIIMKDAKDKVDEEALAQGTAEIAPEFITLELLKILEEKYIVIEVSISYQETSA